ncbi:hypothetical protein [Spirosoma aerophilum]
MPFRFPLKDVVVEQTSARKQLDKATYADEWVQLNQYEFVLDMPEVGWFYACHGKHIDVFPYPDANRSAIELFLNGSVYGAILHQRKTLPFHGSCFRYRGRGIMLCGESGAGKSSLTTAFCLQGADFLTDDVTPIVFKDNKPFIWGVSDRVKLWSDSLRQLQQSESGLEQIIDSREKFYFPMSSNPGSLTSLDLLIILRVTDHPEVSVESLSGIPGFTALRNEIYRTEYLAGMPESEAAYLQPLILISKAVRIVVVYRPEHMGIGQLQTELQTLIEPWTMPVDEEFFTLTEAHVK